MSGNAPVREFTCKQIADAFVLASIGDSPAIGQRDTRIGGWYIRVRTSITIKRDRTATERFDYFNIAEDGTILAAPRGYAKDYRPGRITDIKPMAMIAGILGGRP